MSKQTEALKLALEALERHFELGLFAGATITAIREALAEQPAQQHDYWQEEARRYAQNADFWRGKYESATAQQQEPVAWMPIEQMYPQAKAIDILMGDGSILCAVLPQFDGDLWWDGSGTGEKFIDPKYANVTHWRIHDERTSPPASKPLTDEQIMEMYNEPRSDAEMIAFARAIEAAHGIKGDA